MPHRHCVSYPLTKQQVTATDTLLHVITKCVLNVISLIWKVKLLGRDTEHCPHLQSVRTENCRQGGIEEAASSTMLPVQVNQRPAQAPPQQQQQAPRPPGNDPKKREEFYANIGDAIRTLKKEIPQLFQKDLTCKSVHCSCTSLAGF